MSQQPAERLAHIIRSRRGGSGGVNLEPSSAYEAVTRQMVEDLAREFRDLRHRIDAMLFVITSAILIDLAMRLMGA